MTAMGKGPKSGGYILARYGGKVSKEESQKYDAGEAIPEAGRID
jgi:hypothetical protein